MQVAQGGPDYVHRPARTSPEVRAAARQMVIALDEIAGHKARNLDRKPGCVNARQEAIAKLARQAPELSFTSLNHHIDMDWLYEAYWRTRNDGAPGVDEQNAAA